MNNYTYGLVSVSFRKNLPEEILSAMKDSDLSVIEWGSDVHAPSDDIQNLNELVKLQKKYGISCSSYGTYFRIGVSEKSEIYGIIKAAGILGTDIIRLWAGNLSSKEVSGESKEKFFLECKDLSEIAKENGVKFCLECHNHTYTDDKTAAYELIKYVNSPYFKMYWQPNQFKSFDENIACAKLLSPYTENIHVFNWEGKNKYPLIGAKDAWRTYLSQFDADKTLLLEFMPDDSIDSLKTEADSLRSITEE